jgi:hypothetical protein
VPYLSGGRPLSVNKLGPHIPLMSIRTSPPGLDANLGLSLSLRHGLSNLSYTSIVWMEAGGVWRGLGVDGQEDQQWSGPVEGEDLGG